MNPLLTPGGNPSYRENFGVVSSLYGPGTIAAWYLTAFSSALVCAIPSPRRKDTISSDFVTVIVFPLIASVDLIVQIHSYPGNRLQMLMATETNHLKAIAALDAPHTIVQAFYIVSSVLSLAFEDMPRCRYVVEVATMICFAANAYFHILTQAATLNNLGIAIPVLASFVWHLVLFLPDDAGKVNWGEANRLTRTLRLALIFVTLGWSMGSDPTRSVWGLTVDHLFPRTNSSIRELDQAVALSAGFTVLSWSMFGVVKHWIQGRRREKNERGRTKWPGQSTRTHAQYTSHEWCTKHSNF